MPWSPKAKALPVTINHKTIAIDYNSPRVATATKVHLPARVAIEQTHKSYPVWRAGANPATTLHTDADLTIGELNVPAGTYTLFVEIC